MTKLEVSEKKVKQHTVYKVDGVRVPGVTTILGVLNKPALVKWANNLGLQGIDSAKYVDALANIGTLAHYLVECEWRGEEPDLSTYAPEDIDRAENALLSFWAWRDQHVVEPILVEAALVSAKYRYGGQIDCYATCDGKPTLIDLKTSKGIWPEHVHQLAAYKQLLTEAGYPVANVRILRIGRDETEGFEDRVYDLVSLEPHWRTFELCRELYDLQKVTKGA
jgi:hypothetical protein